MEITPALLIYLGFTAVADRSDTYNYKGIAGRMVEDMGQFYFLGFSQPVIKEVDLRFLLMLIDYQPDESLPSFDVSLN
ncbi:hypothetical protein GCM10028805_25760 [Spirosoma harenae]